MQIEKTNDEVFTVRCDGVVAGWQQDFLLASDVHWDSPHCQRKLFLSHLEEARQRNAGIFIFGDLIDGMGGKNDRRSHKSGIRKEHVTDRYWDAVTNDIVDVLTPYADLLVLMEGNHEAAVRDHLEFDILSNIAHRVGCLRMGYAGFARLMFQREASGSRHCRVLYWHHGHGGGGPVTKGVIETNRRAASVSADIFVSGHIHEAWSLENVVTSVSQQGVVTRTTQLHIQLPTYKQEHTLVGGYHVQNERQAKPQGAFWLQCKYAMGAPGRIHIKTDRAL